jgi:hypothetical protein
MTNSTLTRIIEEVKTLTSEEQRQLQELLDPLLKKQPSQQIEEDLERKLLEAGLLSKVKVSVLDSERYRNYKPVAVKGKPVSETLVEERR